MEQVGIGADARRVLTVNDVGQKILDALGLGGLQWVQAVEIRVAVNEFVFVKVEMVGTGDADDLVNAFAEYELVPIHETKDKG